MEKQELAEKICTKCGEPKPLFEFRPRRGGLETWCKQCKKEDLRRIYRERRKAGLCFQCGKPSNGLSRCKDCLAKGLKHAKKREKKRIDAGLCIFCGKPSDIKYCLNCKNLKNARNKKAKDKKREQGLCLGCSKPSGNYAFCTDCRDVMTQHRRDRVAKNLCSHCGRPSPIYTLCSECLKRQSTWDKNRRESRKQKGLCPLCGSLTSGGYVHCVECRRKLRDRMRKRNKVLRKQGLCIVCKAPASHWLCLECKRKGKK